MRCHCAATHFDTLWLNRISCVCVCVRARARMCEYFASIIIIICINYFCFYLFIYFRRGKLFLTAWIKENVQCGISSTPKEQHFIFIFACPVNSYARYVIISKYPAQGHLHVCEMEVFGYKNGIKISNLYVLFLKYMGRGYISTSCAFTQNVFCKQASNGIIIIIIIIIKTKQQQYQQQQQQQQ